MPTLRALAEVLWIVVLGFVALVLTTLALDGLISALGRACCDDAHAISPLATRSLAQLVALGGVLTFVARVRGTSFRALVGLTELARPTPRSLATLALAFGGGLALQFALGAAVSFVVSLAPSLARSPTNEAMLIELLGLDRPASFAIATVALVVVAPMIEELFFRGALVTVLTPPSGPRSQAVVLGATTLAFAIFHAEPAAMIGAGLAGLVLGIIRLRRDILTSMFVHAGVNAAPLVFGFDAQLPSTHAVAAVATALTLFGIVLRTPRAP